jgi:hypothetical protein
LKKPRKSVTKKRNRVMSRELLSMKRMQEEELRKLLTKTRIERTSGTILMRMSEKIMLRKKIYWKSTNLKEKNMLNS